MLRRIALSTLTILFAATAAFSLWTSTPKQALAAASMAVSATSPVRVGDTFAVTISINTGGASANSFDARFTYPSGLLDPVRGSTSGSVCNIWITQPEPDGGSADISCGKPGGFSGSGTIATIYLSAKAEGNVTFGLSSCSVLANDGQGTEIGGGCSGKSIVINPLSVPATPPPTATPTPTPKPSILPTNTPKPATTPKAPATPGAIGGTATANPGGPSAPNDTPQQPSTTPDPTPPPAASLPPEEPTPSIEIIDVPTEEADVETTESRTISSAFKEVFTSFGDLKSIGGDVTGIVALMLAMIPVLALTCAILFFIYRLFTLEKMRRRGLDRLFEMELSELAALEGKMDLLAEKGTKGREQYREEFKRAKENILRQIKPDYGKGGGEVKPAAEAPKTEPK